MLIKWVEDMRTLHQFDRHYRDKLFLIYILKLASDTFHIAKIHVEMPEIGDYRVTSLTILDRF